MNKTDLEIDSRIRDRFEVLDTMTKSCINGTTRSMIVSGPAGLGKSYVVEKRLSDWDPASRNHKIIKGYVRPTGLVKALYEYRREGQIVVFDDADAIFNDDISLNLLKAVCDTTGKRRVSWLSERKLSLVESEKKTSKTPTKKKKGFFINAMFFVAPKFMKKLDSMGWLKRFDIDDENIVPRTFDFNGTVIFISNLDFDALIVKGHKLAPHLAALVSRSHYIDLELKTPRDYLVRIHQVIDNGLLSDLDEDHKEDVVEFIENNYTSLREISLRMAIKLGELRKGNGDNDWSRIARVTCCK